MRCAVFIAFASLLATGCSTRPREFRPAVATPNTLQTSTAPSPSPEFDRTLIQCQVMVRRGIRGNFANTMAQTAAGASAGFAAGVAASSVVPITGSGFINSAGIAAGSSAMLVVGPLAGFGVSRLIRTGREKKYRASLGNCLSEFGYTVTDWEKQKKLSRAEVKAVLAEVQGSPVPPLPR